MLDVTTVPTPSSSGNGHNKQATGGRRVTIERKHTTQGGDPFALFEWERRVAEIKNQQTGVSVFRQTDLEFPTHWSQNATDITAEKYFRFVEQPDGTKQRETSVRQMVSRVADTITMWGVQQGYFTALSEDASAFHDELVYLLVSQSASFNSPVWFNLGTMRGRVGEEQCSACFINSVDDNMGAILELARTEGMLYKSGSGSGVNYSALRSSREKLSGGGFASGPVPFIAKDDANAGGIKSGGTTRRAAKMAILNVDHGDILEFVRSKAQAERMAHALVDAGFDGDFRARFGAYASVPFQNANHSVRVTDAFMHAVEQDALWSLYARDGKTVIERVRARAIWDEICAAAWTCGDPGLQFDTLINAMHTCPNSGRINASNPCSEYMHVDDSACNLASLNLMRFRQANGTVDVAGLTHAVDVMITAMDILVEGASYPTPQIAKNAHRFRQLGLGYTNLGAVLMANGIAYDSDAARAFAEAVTALVCGQAYRRSAELAHAMGPFSAFAENRQAMIGVIMEHASSASDFPGDASGLEAAASRVWNEALALGDEHGFRNAQATVIAPTGTISFMMDADTTGIEPDVSLVKLKKLVGGGTLKIVNYRVEDALHTLGYSAADVTRIGDYVVRHGSIVGSGVRDEHLAVFDTSLPDPVGGRYLRPEAHILMMGAVQPFVSGAISKTCNLPESATVADIGALYMLAWEQGLKAVALYRDGCKRTQPIQAASEASKTPQAAPAPLRRKLPADVEGPRHKLRVGDHEGYLHMGLFPEDGALGEIFIKMAKQGSTVGGLMDAFGIVTSLALQHGVPLELLVDKLSYLEFNPKGFTGDPNIGHASSIIDAVFRYLGHRFLKKSTPVSAVADSVTGAVQPAVETPRHTQTGNTCPACGHLTQRTGSCFSCSFCGWNGGCG